jgi:hypothetical protein
LATIGKGSLIPVVPFQTSGGMTTRAWLQARGDFLERTLRRRLFSVVVEHELDPTEDAGIVERHLPVLVPALAVHLSMCMIVPRSSGMRSRRTTSAPAIGSSATAASSPMDKLLHAVRGFDQPCERRIPVHARVGYETTRPIAMLMQRAATSPP